MHIAAVVIVFVRNKGKILFLQRSPNRSYYAGKWQMVTGTLDQKEFVEETALREVKEETGLNGKIAYVGKSFEYVDKPLKMRYVIIPFIVDVKTAKIKMSDEHIVHEWIAPKDYKKFDCMPGMKGDLKAVKLI